MKKYFYWCGLIAPIVYVLAVVIGGFLIPHYSHINQVISEMDPLIDEKYSAILNILFGIYNVLTLIYGVMLFYFYHKKSSSFTIQSVSIVLISLGGLLMYFFPMDPIGNPTSTEGVVHIVLSTIMAPLTILVCLLGYWTFNNNEKMRIYSLVSSIIIFVFGGASAAFTANNLPMMGLLERITIGAYITWLFVTSLYYKEKNQ